MNSWDEQQAAGWAKTNKEDTVWKRFSKGLSLAQGQDQDRRIREVLQRITAQVCIRHT
jgi:hypothetical protein